jgi:hypothetical protein
MGDADRSAEDVTCPCRDGVPNPCTLCGEPADGTCQLGTLKMWKHRAQQAEALLREAQRDVDAATRLRAENERLADVVARMDAEHDSLIALYVEVQGGLNYLRAAVDGVLNGPRPARADMREASSVERHGYSAGWDDAVEAIQNVLDAAAAAAREDTDG